MSVIVWMQVGQGGTFSLVFTTVHTDGACSGNPGPGGWAWAAEEGKSDAGGVVQSTNQRMELKAVLQAVTTLHGPLEIVSDSTYVVKCFHDRWYEGWLKRNWKNSAKKPVANRDLWEPLIDAYLASPDRLQFRWVKGHSGDKMNDLVDALAVAEVKKIQDQTKRAEVPTIAAPWSTETAIAIVGPDRASNESYQLPVEVSALVAQVEPPWMLVSGARRGLELSAAHAAQKAGITVAVVLPFAEPAARWPAETKAQFDRICDQAEWVVSLNLDRSDPLESVRLRNEWLVANAAAAWVTDQEQWDTFDQGGVSATLVT